MADMGGPLNADMVIVHYTATKTFSNAFDWLRRKDSVYVSAHKLIGTDGHIEQIVPTTRIAYHAGVSAWEGRTALNRYAIGVELVNPGYMDPVAPAVGWSFMRAAHRNGGPVRSWYTYPPAQIDALLILLDQIGLQKVIGHDHCAPGRKLDPGPAFPWSRLEAAGYDIPLDVRTPHG